MIFCTINGKPQTELSVTDRGLAYGDGLFTTAKIVNGRVVLLDKHIERLVDGATRLKLTVTDKTKLAEQLIEAAKPFKQAVLKVILTAGNGGRGYSRVGLGDNTANVIVMISDFPSNYQCMANQGIVLGVSEQHISASTMLGGIKHLNRLEQVLLKAELDERSEDDLIVTDAQNNVIEAISSNLFYWLDDKLYTPCLSNSGVNGIIRQTLLAHNAQIQVIETKLSSLSKAQSMFICNSLMGIIPVRSYNKRSLDLDKVFELQRKMKTII